MIILLLLSVFSHFPAEIAGVVLHNCCEKGMEMGQGGCVPSENFTINDDYEWFPKNALVTPGGEKLTEEKQNDVMKWIVKNVQYGAYDFSCKKGGFSQIDPEDHREDFQIVVDDTNNVHFQIIKDAITASYRTLSLEDVCFVKTPGMHGAAYCPGHSTPWIQKCCPSGMFFNVTSRNCIKYPINLNLTDWKPHNASGLLQKHFLAMPDGKLRNPCRAYAVLRSKDRSERCRGFPIPNVKFQIQTNGSLIIGKTLLNHDQYCGEKTWHGEGEIIHQNVLYCVQKPKVNTVKGTYGVLFLLGGFLLMATVIISLLLPELRQRIHNKIAITHNGTLMCAHFIWGGTLLYPHHISITTCCILCFSVQFTFLGSLFWMNAMCINLSSTFRATRTVSIKGWEGETRRYCIYSAYAWGLTFLMSVFTITMEYVQKPPFGLPRPGFSCFCDFDRKSFSVFVYFYGPMVVLLIFNLVLYIFTTLKIMSVVRESKRILQHSDSNTTGGTLQSDKQMLILYTKLFFLMGITWMTEIIGWAVGASADNVFFFVLDIINVLRAVFIFILFVCKPRILRKVWHYLLRASGRLRRSGSSHSVTDVTISSTAPSRKVSQHEEVSRKRSIDEWVHMKPMDRSKDKAIRIMESLIPEEAEQTNLLDENNENIPSVKV